MWIKKMKVQELRELLKAADREFLEKAFVESYKQIPKIKKEDTDQMIRDILAGKEKEAKKQPEAVDFGELEQQIGEFLVNARAQNYVVPNRIIPKNQRQKWRFLVKGYIQELDREQLDRDELYEKAMEIRMFNEEEEVKWFRGADQKLQCRERKDQEDQMDPLFFWDEWQYLDINEQKSKPEKGIAYATGGGRYELPLKDYRDAQIKIRNYLEYEEDTMQLYISDWRIIGFSKERGE